MSQHFRDEGDWHPPYRLMRLGALDEDLKTSRSHDDDVPLRVGCEGWNWGQMEASGVTA